MFRHGHATHIGNGAPATQADNCNAESKDGGEFAIADVHNLAHFEMIDEELNLDFRSTWQWQTYWHSHRA